MELKQWLKLEESLEKQSFSSQLEKLKLLLLAEDNKEIINLINKRIEELRSEVHQEEKETRRERTRDREEKPKEENLEEKIEEEPSKVESKKQRIYGVEDIGDVRRLYGTSISEESLTKEENSRNYQSLSEQQKKEEKTLINNESTLLAEKKKYETSVK